MARFNDFDRMMASAQTVFYKGVEMPRSKRDALVRAEKRKEKYRKRNACVVELLKPQIETIMRSFKLCKSMYAYYHNGYRQWGTIIYEIIRNPLIEPHFSIFLGKYNDAKKAYKKIEEISKKNDKDIFGYVEKLAYLTDDMSSELVAIADSIIDAHIYSNKALDGKEAIYGVGRRLGIRELCSRTTEAVISMQKSFHELISMVESGVDAMEYDANSKKTITFVKG